MSEWIPSRLYRMSVDEYVALVQSGALKPRNHLHFVNGYLVAKTTQNPPHWVADELCGAAMHRSGSGSLSRLGSRTGAKDRLKPERFLEGLEYRFACLIGYVDRTLLSKSIARESNSGSSLAFVQ